MADADRELTELRREIVETRNQAIKTDNQVKNLSLDVKGFERRFDVLERRTRVASLGAHAIVAVTIVAASYIVHTLRVKALTQEIKNLVVSTDEAKKGAEQAAATARAKQTALDQERTRREKAASVALKLVDNLDKNREKEAIELLDGVDLASLTPLESKLLDKRVGELRSRAAETAYKNGRNAQNASQHAAAIAELRRAISLEPDGRFAPPSRYYLAVELWNLKRHEEAEPVLREIVKRDTDRNVVEEARFLLGVSVAATGKRDEARSIFNDIVQRGGRYTANARDQLALLDRATKPGEAHLAPASTPAPAPLPVPAPAPVAPAPGAPAPVTPAPAATPATATPAPAGPTPSAATPAPAPAPAPAPRPGNR